MKFLRIGAVAASFFVCVSNNVYAANGTIECKVPLSEKICYTLSHESRECIEEPKELAPYNLGEQLDLIHSVSPVGMQHAICSLDQVFVDRDFMEHASGFQRATEIHLSWEAVHSFQTSMESFVERDFSRFARGGIFYEYDESILPRNWRFSDAHSLDYNVDYLNGRLDNFNYALAYLFYHEIAHLIERHPKFNKLSGYGYFVCNAQYQQAKQDALRLQGNVIKGYVGLLDDYPKAGQNSDLLKELQASNYVSFYATSNHNEDFAEVLASWIMHEHLGVTFQVLKGKEVLFDRSQQFRNENMRIKQEIVKMVLGLPELANKERRPLRLDRKLCRNLFDPTLMTQID